MIELLPTIPPRDPIVLTRRETGEKTNARLTMLTRRIAATGIAEGWWTGGSSLQVQYQKEPDRHWDWDKEVEHAVADPDIRRNYVLLTADRRRITVEGSIAMDFSGKSLIEPGKPAVYVKYLATNPKNRRHISSSGPTFNDVGRSLMMIAILESFLARFEGRVLLMPLEKSVGFYEKLNFVRTLDRTDQSTYYEIERDKAASCLKKAGWI